jgi:hypothetical protein
LISTDVRKLAAKSLAERENPNGVKTVLSHWQAVESVETLRKMMRYLGATDEQMESFEDSVRSWGQSSVTMRLLPNRRNLLHIDFSRL